VPLCSENCFNMHLFFLHRCPKLCIIHHNKCFACAIYEGDQSNLYRKCVVIVLNTRGFMSKIPPNLLYNVNISVRFYVPFLRVLGDFVLRDVPTEQICSDTSGLASKVCILRHNKVGCMSQLCRFFVQTVSIIRLNARFLDHIYNDASKVCHEQSSRNRTDCLFY